jgi:RHH-type rel operon transcriptional repressor/antitoxin RelB
MSTKLWLKLPDDIAEKLSEFAEETKRPKSYHIQKALELYLAELADLHIAYDRLHEINDPVISVEEIKNELEF